MNSRRFTGLFLSIAACFALAACSSNPEAITDSSKDANSATASKDSGGLLGHLVSSSSPVTLPAGTAMSVILDQSISSKNSHAGESFTGTIGAPIVADGKTVIPQGAPVRGILVDTRESGRLSGVAHLELALQSIEVNGKSYDVKTNTLSRTGKNHDKRNAVLIGGGTGFGALVGAIAGGGKGAAIGAAAGAGAGTATAAATGKQDITLPVESRLQFKLSEPLTIQVKS